MISGGVRVKKYTSEAIRLSALFLPLLLFLYGLLIRTGLLATDHYAGDTVLQSIMVPWMAISVFSTLFRSRTTRSIWALFAANHIFAALYLIFISGFMMPFIAAWVLLVLMSYVYLSNRGVYLSLSVLALTAIADTVRHAGNDVAVLANTVTFLAIFVVSILIVTLFRIERADKAELTKSKAKESLQRDRIDTLINNLADAVISTDEKGVVQVYNAAALNLLNTNISLNGRHINNIVGIIDTAGEPVDLYGIITKLRGMTVRDDLQMNQDGEIMRLEITSSPIRSSYSRLKKPGSPDGYIVIMRDVTKAKSLEEERDEFISVVSHELRTPITIAEGTLSNAQLMLARGNLPAATLQESLAAAHDQVMFLAKMVNDLSTLSRAERGVGDEPESINLHELLGGLYTEYAPQAEKKKLHFNLDAAGKLGTITASRLYLHELLQNFITNSIKYTKEGAITLRVEREAKTVRFEVKDTGIGISKSDQAKIFNKFYRSEDYRTRETGGTGLGLYVAAKLAKKLNTTIEVKSRLNHGSSFSITLPADDVSTTAS